MPATAPLVSELHRSEEALHATLDDILASPREAGTLRAIVRRPSEDERESLSEARLHPDHGLVGDMWSRRASSRTADGSPHPDCQLTLMNARVAQAVAGDVSRWSLAGDQLYVDLDLSTENLPSGTRLRLGSALLEVTDQPHTGCRKFVDRFGMAAMRFISAKERRMMNFRGIYARVIEAGTISVGDLVTRA